MPSAEVKPTWISKVRSYRHLQLALDTTLIQVNTALQLILMGVTTVSPLVSLDLNLALQGFQ